MTTNVTAIAANPAVDVLSEQVQQAIYQKLNGLHNFLIAKLEFFDKIKGGLNTHKQNNIRV